MQTEFPFYLGNSQQNRNDIKNGSILRLTTSPVSFSFQVHKKILLQCAAHFVYAVFILPLPFPFLLFSHPSTRQQSSFMSGSSHPAWMPSWRPWKTWPTHRGTSPLPRSSSTWMASPCLLKWWRVGLSKLVVCPPFLLLWSSSVAGVFSHCSLCDECDREFST